MIRLGLWVRFVELLAFELNFENKGNQLTGWGREVFPGKHGDLLPATVCV